MTEPVDLTVSENRRLQREVKQLRARVEALERSRWWRLHPRRAAARLAKRVPSRPAAAESFAPTPRASVRKDGTVQRFRTEVIERGEFTEDWFTVHIPAWAPVLDELEGRGANVLELGSFEGLSACFLLWRLRDAHITCVDTFAGIPAYRAYGIEQSQLEARFDRNVALVDATRVRTLIGSTHRVLPQLLEENATFDLLYVDASHRALDVLADLALSWQLLTIGGIAILDDYGPIPPGDDALNHPAPAIDAFRTLLEGRLETVDQARQLILRRTS